MYLFQVKVKKKCYWKCWLSVSNRIIYRSSHILVLRWRYSLIIYSILNQCPVRTPPTNVSSICYFNIVLTKFKIFLLWSNILDGTQMCQFTWFIMFFVASKKRNHGSKNPVFKIYGMYSKMYFLVKIWANLCSKI